MRNNPAVKLGIVAVSHDCFPAELSKRRLVNVLNAAKDIALDLVACSTIIESESDSLKALEEFHSKGVNAVA